MEDLILWLIFAVFFGIPLGSIARKAGRSPLFGLIALIPFGLFVGLGILAYGRWPSEKEG